LKVRCCEDLLLNAAHRTAADFGLHLSFKGRVWVAAVLGCIAIWAAVIWFGLHLLGL
jgi:hypothetical protein